MNELLSIQSKLNGYAGIEGCCDGLFDIIADLTAPLCDDLFRLPGGTPVCHMRGEGKPLLLWTCIASPGFYVEGYDDSGFARALACGLDVVYCENTPLRTQSGERAVLRADEVYGDKTTADTRFFFDLGDVSGDMPPVGTPFMFDTDAVEIANGRIMTPFGESIAPCAVLLRVMERARSLGRELYFAFVDRPAGAVQTAAIIKPDMAVCVTAQEARDADAKPDARGVTGISAGPVMKLRDAGAPCMSSNVTDSLEAAAKGIGLSLRHDVSNDGDCGFSGVQFACGGIPSATLALPVRGCFTPCCIYDTGDADALENVLVGFIAGKGCV